jgi:hypothetical protein
VLEEPPRLARTSWWSLRGSNLRPLSYIGVRQSSVHGTKALSLKSVYQNLTHALQGDLVAGATAFSVVYPGRRLSGNRAGVELRETNRSSTLVNPRTRSFTSLADVDAALGELGDVLRLPSRVAVLPFGKGLSSRGVPPPRLEADPLVFRHHGTFTAPSLQLH